MKRVVALLPVLVLSLAAVPPPDESSSELPFSAWMANRASLVYEAPNEGSRLLGRLRWGDPVTVAECRPDCATANAWARIEPSGWVRLASLRVGDADPVVAERSATATFQYVKVGVRGATTRAERDPRSTPLGRHRADDYLAIVPDESRHDDGWLARPGGGFVALAEVRRLPATTFGPVRDPEGPIVFVTNRRAQLSTEDGTTRPVARYERFPYLGDAPRGRVRVPGGTLLRTHVRIARSRPRPVEVPAGTRWVHVDLTQQVLTAYEGDRPVLVSLVSSGAAVHPTETGSYRVLTKAVHEDMRGPPRDPYIVEEVPWVMYFHRDQALHGAYWHDSFGTQLSHGCVNLPPSVARELFHWAPPDLPRGWASVFPAHSRTPSLRVIVTRR